MDVAEEEKQRSSGWLPTEGERPGRGGERPRQGFARSCRAGPSPGLPPPPAGLRVPEAGMLMGPPGAVLAGEPTLLGHGHQPLAWGVRRSQGAKRVPSLCCWDRRLCTGPRAVAGIHGAGCHPGLSPQEEIVPWAPASWEVMWFWGTSGRGRVGSISNQPGQLRCDRPRPPWELSGPARVGWVPSEPSSLETQGCAGAGLWPRGQP